MRDSRLNMAEWSLQPRFIRWLIAGVFLTLAADSRQKWPDRVPGLDRLAALRFEPLELQASGGATVLGAWKVEVDDPRFAGLSALAVSGGWRLLALSDSGVLIDLPQPATARRAARLRDLPDGPGPATFKKYRDAEAMVVDPDGSGRWVTFEYNHSLWRFTEGGRSVAFGVPSRGWSRNKGVEAMLREPGGALLLLPEDSRRVWRFTGLAGRSYPLAGATGAVADAASLPDGRVVVAVRELGITGLTNHLAWLERRGEGYRLRNFAALDLGPFDNVEGLAIEADSAGRTILWAVTDNDGWRRSLLLRIRLNTQKAPAAAGAS